MGQGSQYAVLTVKHSLAVQKAAISGNAEGRWKVKKMKKIKNELKELGCALLFSIGVLTPFALHVLGVL